MKLTRRQMLLASLSTLAAGCTSAAFDPAVRRPGPAWPSDIASPSDDRAVVYRPQSPHPQPVVTSNAPVAAIPRSRWTRAAAVPARVNPMKGIGRITVHHEGSTTFWSADQRATADRLERIRAYHVNQRRFGDIGYHYIIDRAGNIWEGRSIRFQGAHVSRQNEHNIGVMCLGNFDKQSPTNAQIATLRGTVAALAAYYSVPRNRIFTHRELGPTTCPGSNLQPRVASMRASGELA